MFRRNIRNSTKWSLKYSSRFLQAAALKTLSVTRLELTGSILAVKLDKMFRRGLEVATSRSVFWTDSTSVLRFIQNEDKRFHTFVSNRLIVIHDGSTPDQWRFIDTTRNPSDVASIEGCPQTLCLWLMHGSVDRTFSGKVKFGGLHSLRLWGTFLMAIMREGRVDSVQKDKSRETIDKLLLLFLLLAQASKVHGILTALQVMLAKQGLWQVRRSKWAVPRGKGKCYCR